MSSYSKINPSDCLDMSCDAKKKALVKDMEGSYLGAKGMSVIAQSEYEWDGDERYGTGNYRVPTAMVSDPSEIDVIAPNKGWCIEPLTQVASKCQFCLPFAQYRVSYAGLINNYNSCNVWHTLHLPWCICDELLKINFVFNQNRRPY